MIFSLLSKFELSSIYVFSYFPFGFEGRIWDLIVSVPDHCLSFYFEICAENPEVCKRDIFFLSLTASLNQSKGHGCICLDLSLDLLSF